MAANGKEMEQRKWRKTIFREKCFLNSRLVSLDCYIIIIIDIFQLLSGKPQLPNIKKWPSGVVLFM